MRYELQSIPVWKAFEADTECALCSLEEEAEARNTGFFLGNSIMAPEMRVEVNEHGFCPRHFHMLLEGQGKLGYSLALATHIEELTGKLERLERDLLAASEKPKNAKRALSAYTAALADQERDCLMCGRIRRNMLNYAYTIVKLFSDDGEFRKLFERSRGLCLHHLPLVLDMGPELLRGAKLREWHESLIALQHRSWKRIGEQLEQFSWQFDYQSEKQTPPEAKDIVPRAVRKLAGFGPTRLP